MSLYPVFLKLKDTPCLVIGGGKVAERKARSLLEAQARVTLIAPAVTHGLADMATGGAIKHLEREFEAGDLEGYVLAIAATNSPEVNREIYREATSRRILVNAVDDRDNSNFYVPSVVRRGDLQLAISTSGRVPYFAGKLRQYFEAMIYDGIDEDLRQLSKMRTAILEEHFPDRKEKMRRMATDLDPKIDEIFERMNTE